MAQRPVTTLFMLMSLDGKISPGASDLLDVDTDFPKLPGIREGLHQYYEIEQSTDLWSLNTGRVMSKLGANHAPLPQRTPASFVILDNTHLTAQGVRWLCAKASTLVLVTSDPNHPAFGVQEENLHILFQDKPDLGAMLETLYADHNCRRLTIQSGGTMNGRFLREKLFDYVDIVVAPILVGGSNVSTLIDGAAITLPEELNQLSALRLESCQPLADSYLRLRYQVIS